MEDDEHLERAMLAERLADEDGEQLAAILNADWGERETAAVVEALQRTARRLSFLVGCCRLAASRLQRML
jgi:hypothetical protein